MTGRLLTNFQPASIIRTNVPIGKQVGFGYIISLRLTHFKFYGQSQPQILTNYFNLNSGRISENSGQFVAKTFQLRKLSLPQNS
jgi:hypothetical protein